MTSRVYLLGRVAVRVGEETVDVRGGKQRLLTCLLGQSAGEVVRADRLVDALWGSGAAGDLRHRLEAQVSRLRAQLRPADVDVERRGDGYRLSLHAVDVDAGALALAVGSGRRARQSGELEEAQRWLSRAVDLAAGRPFAEHREHRDLEAEGVRLEELGRTAIEGFVDVELAAGRAAAVLPQLRSWARAQPLREGLWARLMRAHYLVGDQAAALSAHDELAERLATELGLDPSPAVAELRTAILQQAPGLGHVTQAGEVGGSHRPGGTPLPTPTTPLVGRRQLRDELVSLLADGSRVLTLTGSGGIGKTRLAIAVADEAASRRSLVARFVDLAAVADASQVEREAAVALGIDEVPGESLVRTMLRRLADHQLLLVLDNCEHVVAAAADLVARLLPGLPGLVVLATSRRPLDLYGETVRRVPSLELPPMDVDDEPALVASAAGRLFVDRARSVCHDLFDEPGAAGLVAAICTQLDGIPLAIELAASQLDTHRLASLHATLDEQLGVLRARWRDAPDRHRTIGDTIAWSHDLLDETDRWLFNVVATFSGPFTARAAARVVALAGADVADVPARLDELVRRSLLLPAPPAGDQRRYRMLEPLRRFGELRRVDAGDDTRIREAHLEHAVQVLEGAARRLQGPQEAEALADVDAQVDDLRAALGWAQRTGRVTAGLRAATGLSNHANLRGLLREAVDRLHRFVDAAGDDPDDPLLLGRALTALCRLEGRTGRLPAARAHGDRAVDLLQDAGHPVALGYAVLNRAMVWYGAVPPTTSLADFERARGILREAGDRYGTGFAMLMRTLALLHVDPQEAARSADDVLTALEASGDRNAIAHGREAVALAALVRDEVAVACDRYARAVEMFDDLGNAGCLAHALHGAAACLLARDRPGEAAELLGAAEGVRRDLATTTAPYERPLGERIEQDLSRALAPEAARAARDRGAELGARDAAVLARRALRRGLRVT